jgi:hypothetical protein
MAEQYLRFERDLPAESGKKTQVWEVISARHGYRLGEVRWFGQWRQYALQAEPDTVWSHGCLDEVAAFIRKLMADRK